MSGCETKTMAAAVVGGVASDFLSFEEVNLTEKNYAAADYLAGQMEPFVSKNAPIAVRPLTLVREPAISSELGHKIPEEVGMRLEQLGYNVLPGENAPGSVRDAAIKKGTPRFLLGGTYETDRRDVSINLRMVRVETGRVAGAFDYVLPRSGKMRKLSTSEAEIFRVSE